MPTPMMGPYKIPVPDIMSLAYLQYYGKCHDILLHALPEAGECQFEDLDQAIGESERESAGLNPKMLLIGETTAGGDLRPLWAILQEDHGVRFWCENGGFLGRKSLVRSLITLFPPFSCIPGSLSLSKARAVRSLVAWCFLVSRHILGIKVNRHGFSETRLAHASQCIEKAMKNGEAVFPGRLNDQDIDHPVALGNHAETTNSTHSRRIESLKHQLSQSLKEIDRLKDTRDELEDIIEAQAEEIKGLKDDKKELQQDLDEAKDHVEEMLDRDSYVRSFVFSVEPITDFCEDLLESMGPEGGTWRARYEKYVKPLLYWRRE